MASQACRGTSPSPQRRDRPVELGVVLVAALVAQLPPVLAVSAGGGHDHVLAVVQVVQGVARLRADPVHVTFTLRRKN